MSQYLTRRHQCLMDESEQALLDARESHSERFSRISSQILNDSKVHSLWESRHAKLLLPVAEQRKQQHQIVNLRLVATRLVHGRAMIEYIRDNEIRGRDRERLFTSYFPLMDCQSAILAAHRDYMLSLSSTLSTNHIINLMYDPVSHRLMQAYSAVYRQYFKLSSFIATSDDELCARALTPLVDSARTQLGALKRKLMTEPPHTRCAEFEKQASIARSGRYPVLDYMPV